MSGENKPEEIQVVIFSLEDEEYCVDISSLREIIRVVDITRIPKMPDFIEGVINLRGQTTTVIDLRKRFEMDSAIKDTNRIMIVELKNETIGMIVDSVSEVRTVLIDQIDSIPSIKDARTQDYLKGIFKDNDRIIIFLDIDKILSELELEQTESIKGDFETTDTL